MKRIYLVLFSVLLLFCASPASGQSGRDDIADSAHTFEEWTKNLAEFVKDVRFNEGDVQSLISLYDDFNSFGEEMDDGEGEYVDFNAVLNDPEYLSWARSKGINSETWLKKTMRISAVIMRIEIEENRPEEPFDMQAQLAELEEMRAQIGEEAYRQMTQALAAGAAAMAGMEESYKLLPVPSDAEKALIEKYYNQLMNLE